MASSSFNLRETYKPGDTFVLNDVNYFTGLTYSNDTIYLTYHLDKIIEANSATLTIPSSTVTIATVKGTRTATLNQIVYQGKSANSVQFKLTVSAMPDLTGLLPCVGGLNGVITFN